MDALERDFYEERRRRWRRAAFWRGFLVAAVLAIVIASLSLGERIAAATDHVARFTLDGIIVEDREREELLAELAERGSVKAVILRINSPGGTTAGSEAVYESLRAIAAEKPVVAVLGEVAASGGYIAALGADHIVSRGNSLTGSIGVIMEVPDVTELMERVGIGLETFRSSELKAEPSPFREMSPAARAETEAMVAESFAWFRDLVAERRGLAGAALDRAASGGVFTGRLALEARLVDALGGEAEARAWLESRQAGLGTLPVRDWEVERQRTLADRLLAAIAPSSGILEEIVRGTGAKLYSLAP